MDIEQYKKIVESRLKAFKIKQHVKSEIENYEDQQIIGYEASKLKYKPFMEDVNEVKKTIDKKQDQLINQMKQNQLAIIDNLPKINNGVRLEELEDASVKKEPPIILETNYDDNLTDTDIHFLHNEKLSLPSKLFNEGIKYSQKDNKIFNEYLIQLNDLRNELAHKNKIVKINPEYIAPRKKYYTTIEKIIDALKTIKVKTGSGIRNIRKYKQPKRNAYKISQNKYGGMIINMPKLMNEMFLEVSKGGNIIYQDKIDRFVN